jgi:multidrug efflux pump subunit AcrA (membrane-fusion protein)
MLAKWVSRGFAFLWACVSVAGGQTLPTSARIESVPLELTMPERYQVAELLEPVRRVTLIAPSDGFVRSIEFRLGSPVKELQEIAQLDRGEASAQLKIAAAEVKEQEAELKGHAASDLHRSHLDAAKARMELAQIALDHCTLRAPFSGRLVALPVCAGQYVLKGTTIAELADVSALKTLLPVDRRSVASGASLTVQVEGQELTGKVQAVVPLPLQYVALRELATPLAGAWVVVPNAKGELEPGLRVRPTTVPVTPIATIPKRAVKQGDARSSEGAMVQVIRNEYVTNVPVRVLGDTGPERTQITGLLRRTDALIVSSSVSLLAGTLVRFGDGSTQRGIEGQPPDPSHGGAEAGISGPSGSYTRPGAVGGQGAAPRGSSGTQTKTPTTPPVSGAAPF